MRFGDEIRVCYSVTDFDTCRAFYEEALGLDTYKEWDHGEAQRGVVYHLGGTYLELLEAAEVTSQVDQSSYIYVMLEDLAELQAVYDGLEKGGFIVRDLKEQAWGHVNFMARDPAGHQIKFFIEA